MAIRRTVQELDDGRQVEVIVMAETAGLYIAHFAMAGRVLVMLTYRSCGNGVTIRAKRLPPGNASAATDLARLLDAAVLVGKYIEAKVAEAVDGPTIQ